MAEPFARDVQKGVELVLTIDGKRDDWRRFFPETMDLSFAGFGVLAFEAGLQQIADINRKSLESEVVGALAWLKGLELVELQVESTMHPEWGVMLWIPDHPSYSAPPTSSFQAGYRMSFYRAMFQTEKAGVQQFCLYSTAINGRFHKTLVFRRAAFVTRVESSVMDSVVAGSPA